ncbi:MAG: helix-hairpin-helix domain-containing protein [Planctomycetota bacterium]
MSPALARSQIQRGLRMTAFGVLLVVAVLGWQQRPRFSPRGRAPLRIDLNTATLQELTLLPGIGGTMANRIVSDRRHRGDFHSVAELARVRGIGERTVAAIEPYCVAIPSENSSDRVVVAKPPID